MSETIQLVGVVQNPEGSIELSFLWHGDLYAYVYPSLEQLQAEMEAACSTAAEVARLLLSFWLSRDPKLENPKSVIGQPLEIDTTATSDVLAVTKTSPTLCWTRSLLT